MTQHPHAEPECNKAEPSCQTGGVSRRQVVRIGLAAAPVLAALQSNTVLAGVHDCVRPSSFSSLAPAGMRISRGRALRTDYECRSHDFWKNNQGNLTTQFKQQAFLSPAHGFTANPGQAYERLSFHQVLDLNGNAHNAALARHVVAAFLSAVSVHNDSSRVWLTRAQCNAIWNGQGVWSPFAGTTWTLAQTMDYFDRVYGAPFIIRA